MTVTSQSGKKKMRTCSNKCVFFTYTELLGLKHFLINGNPLEFWSTDSQRTLYASSPILGTSTTAVKVTKTGNDSFILTIKDNLINFYIPVFSDCGKLQVALYHKYTNEGGDGMPITMISYDTIHKSVLTLFEKFCKIDNSGSEK